MKSFKQFLTEYGETEVEVPHMVRRGTITNVDWRQTRQNLTGKPASIAIDVDGLPAMYVTPDELRRIQRRNRLGHVYPEELKGRSIEILIQRHPNDRTDSMSRIEDVRIY